MKIQPLKQISFNAGKTTLYSDFDGTFYPYPQNFNFQDDKSKSNADGYFSKFNILKKNFDKNLDIKLTTGRTFGEIKDIFQKAANGGVSMPMPSSIITKNGGDEFFNNNTSSSFPFDKISVNTEKRLDIEKISNGWDGQKIQAKLIDILEDKEFKIVLAPTNGPIEDYGNLTSQTIIKNNKDTDIALMRQDGMLGFNITFNLANNSPKVINDVKNEIKTHLQNNNIHSIVIESDSDFGAKGLPSLTLLPVVYGAALTKTYDISKAIDAAKKENDLVIVAGDGGNDKEALNPASYVTRPNDKYFPRYIENSETKTYKEDNRYYVNSKLDGKEKRAYFAQYLNSLKDYIQTNPEYKQELAKLPLKSIIIGDTHESLNKLVDTYKNAGLADKILQIQKGTLPEGVRTAINSYKLENKCFETALNTSNKNAISDTNIEYHENQVILKDINNLNQDTTTPRYNPVNCDLKVQNCLITVKNFDDGTKYLKIKDNNNQTIITVKVKNSDNLPQINLHTGNYKPAIELKDKDCAVFLSEDSYIKSANFDIATGKYVDKARSNISFGQLYVTEAYKASSIQNAVNEYFLQEKFNDVSNGKYKDQLKNEYSMVGLAAGYGSRLSIISDNTGDAKPATPFITNKYRLIDFSVLNPGIKAGIINPNSINSNKSGTFDTINKRILSGENANLMFLRETEEKPIGTGGSLFSALKNNVVKTDKPLVLATGDLYTNVDLSYALKEFENKNAGLLVVYKQIGENDITKLPIIKLDKYEGTNYVKQFCHLPNNKDEESYIRGLSLQDIPNKYATTTSIYIMHPKVLEILKQISGEGKQSFGSYLPILLQILNGEGKSKIVADDRILSKLREMDLIDSQNISKGLRDDNGHHLTMIADMAKREDGVAAVAEDVGTYKRYLEQARKTAANKFGEYDYFPKEYLSEIKNLVDLNTGVVFADSDAKTNFKNFKTKQNIEEIYGDVLITNNKDKL